MSEKSIRLQLLLRKMVQRLVIDEKAGAEFILENIEEVKEAAENVTKEDR